ncbi:MAG: amino acid permease family protein [Caballeronia mineralivorans]|jgi:hypothetical protein|nr:amino acid permease family protein [Caballeronia mineralivorans]
MLKPALKKLRYCAPELKRPFPVPGGLVGMWIFAGVGLAGVVFSFVVQQAFSRRSVFSPDRGVSRGNLD